MLSLSKSEATTCYASDFLSTMEKQRITILNYIIVKPLSVGHVAFTWELFYCFYFMNVDSILYQFWKVSS